MQPRARSITRFMSSLESVVTTSSMGSALNGICFSFSSSSSRSAGLSQGGPLGSLASLKPTRLVKILRSAPRVMVPNISMGSPGDRGGVSLTGGRHRAWCS